MIPGGAMTARCFPPPWSVEDIGGSFVVKASNERPLVFIYYREGVGRRSLAKFASCASRAGPKPGSGGRKFQQMRMVYAQNRHK
jgi:hypothetical protein